MATLTRVTGVVDVPPSTTAVVHCVSATRVRKTICVATWRHHSKGDREVHAVTKEGGEAWELAWRVVTVLVDASPVDEDEVEPEVVCIHASLLASPDVDVEAAADGISGVVWEPFEGSCFEACVVAPTVSREAVKPAPLEGVPADVPLPPPEGGPDTEEPGDTESEAERPPPDGGGGLPAGGGGGLPPGGGGGPPLVGPAGGEFEDSLPFRDGPNSKTRACNTSLSVSSMFERLAAIDPFVVMTSPKEYSTEPRTGAEVEATGITGCPPMTPGATAAFPTGAPGTTTGVVTTVTTGGGATGGEALERVGSTADAAWPDARPLDPRFARAVGADGRRPATID